MANLVSEKLQQIESNCTKLLCTLLIKEWEMADRWGCEERLWDGQGHSGLRTQVEGYEYIKLIDNNKSNDHE